MALQDGEPVLASLQVNVRELPVVPPALDGVALMTLFVGPRQLPVGAPNGTNWSLRAYRELTSLVELEEPSPARAGDPKARKGEHGTYARPPIRWRAVDDYPSRDDWPIERYDEYDELDEELGDDLPRPHEGIKVGGWPTTVQHELDWGRHTATGPPQGSDIDFLLQVDSEARIGFAVGFGGASTWARQQSVAKRRGMPTGSRCDPESGASIARSSHARQRQKSSLARSLLDGHANDLDGTAIVSSAKRDDERPAGR